MSVVTKGKSKDMQQTGEKVKYTHKQCHRGHDVVGLTAFDDLLSLEQNQASHQQDKHAGYREAQSRQLEEQVTQTSQKRDQNTDKQKFAHE